MCLLIQDVNSFHNSISFYATAYRGDLYRFVNLRWEKIYIPISPHLLQASAVRDINVHDVGYIVVLDDDTIIELTKGNSDEWNSHVLFNYATDHIISAPIYDRDRKIISFVDTSEHINIFSILEKSIKKFAPGCFSFYEWVNKDEILYLNVEHELRLYNTTNDIDTVFIEKVSNFSLSDNKNYLFYCLQDVHQKGTLVDMCTGEKKDVLFNYPYFITASKPTDDGKYLIASIDKRENNMIYAPDVYIITINNNAMKKTNYPANYANIFFFADLI
jgi:hypothetical protein